MVLFRDNKAYKAPFEARVCEAFAISALVEHGPNNPSALAYNLNEWFMRNQEEKASEEELLMCLAASTVHLPGFDYSGDIGIC